MRFLLAFCFALILTNGLAQDAYEIRLRYDHLNGGERFELEFQKRGGLSYIHLAEFDSLSRQWSEKDSILRAAMEWKLRKGEARLSPEEMKDFLDLFRKYEHFKTDSLVIKVADPLTFIADSIVKTSTAELKGDDWGVAIDGASVSVEIISKDQHRAFRVWSPSKSSHPLIHGLIQGILDRYRSGELNILKEKILPVGIPLPYDTYDLIEGRDPDIIISIKQ